MLSAELLKFVRCPEDGSELTVAGEGLVRQVNAAIRKHLGATGPLLRP